MAIALKDRKTQFPVGPRARFPGQLLLDLRRDPLRFLQTNMQRFGELSHFSIGPQHVYLVNRPDYIRDILVTHEANFHKGRGLQVAQRLVGKGLLTSEDELHKSQRRLMQPVFHRMRLGGFADTMVATTRQHCQGWTDGARLDLHEELSRLTLRIVGKTLFSTDLDPEADALGRALTEARGLFWLGTLPFWEIAESLLPGFRHRFEQVRGRMDEVIYRLIREHREQPREDLLSMLIEARDRDSMSDEQLRDEAVTLMLAGHETTANALSWAFYLLGRNGHLAYRAQQEVDQVLQGRSAGLDDVSGLPFLEAVVLESMRLYPPAWMVGRRALEDYPIGDFVAPAGSIMLMSQYVSHRREDYFANAERFDPDRWQRQSRQSLEKYRYFPFGGGSRVCIGEHFAMMEMVLILATLLQNYQFSLLEDRVRPEPGITLRPKPGILVRLRRRSAD